VFKLIILIQHLILHCRKLRRQGLLRVFVTSNILRLLFLFFTSWAWRCENLFAYQSSPSPSHSPYHSPFTPVELGHGVDLFEEDYLLLPAADLRMDPALRPRPVSSVAFAYLGDTPQLNYSIERRHIYSRSGFRCDIHSTTPIGMCFSILRVRRNI
jgi:hypothetical protein